MGTRASAVSQLQARDLGCVLLERTSTPGGHADQELKDAGSCERPGCLSSCPQAQDEAVGVQALPCGLSLGPWIRPEARGLRLLHRAQGLEASWDLLRPFPWEMRILHDFFPTPINPRLWPVVTGGAIAVAFVKHRVGGGTAPTSGKGVSPSPQQGREVGIAVLRGRRMLRSQGTGASDPVF